MLHHEFPRPRFNAIWTLLRQTVRNPDAIPFRFGVAAANMLITNAIRVISNSVRVSDASQYLRRLSFHGFAQGAPVQLGGDLGRLCSSGEQGYLPPAVDEEFLHGPNPPRHSQ